MKVSAPRSFTTFITLALFMVLAGTLAAQDVQSDWDKSKNFGEYHTYYWAKIDSPNPLMVQRLQDAVDAQLEKKGWSKQQDGGQVALVGLGTSSTKKNLNTFYSGTGWGYGGWYGAGGMGSSTTTVSEYREGTLVLDMYDSNSRQLLWRGTATDTMSDKPEKNEKKLNKAIEKLFKKFPPESKSPESK
ncbi:MAG: DUF4136 domain-containing protein [Acidobacteriales bacterium]|nr:DUF4136 domain-containing protein [Terriglobales bacterium]